MFIICKYFRNLCSNTFILFYIIALNIYYYAPKPTITLWLVDFWMARCNFWKFPIFPPIFGQKRFLVDSVMQKYAEPIFWWVLTNDKLCRTLRVLVLTNLSIRYLYQDQILKYSKYSDEAFKRYIKGNWTFAIFL